MDGSRAGADPGLSVEVGPTLQHKIFWKKIPINCMKMKWSEIWSVVTTPMDTPPPLPQPLSTSVTSEDALGTGCVSHPVLKVTGHKKIHKCPLYICGIPDGTPPMDPQIMKNTSHKKIRMKQTSR